MDAEDRALAPGSCMLVFGAALRAPARVHRPAALRAVGDRSVRAAMIHVVARDGGGLLHELLPSPRDGDVRPARRVDHEKRRALHVDRFATARAAGTTGTRRDALEVRERRVAMGAWRKEAGSHGLPPRVRLLDDAAQRTMHVHLEDAAWFTSRRRGGHVRGAGDSDERNAGERVAYRLCSWTALVKARTETSAEPAHCVVTAARASPSGSRYSGPSTWTITRCSSPVKGNGAR